MTLFNKKKKYLYSISIFIILIIIYYSVKKHNASKTEPYDAKFLELTKIHKVKIMPGPYDWLAQHDEDGQTFEEYIKLTPKRPDSRRKYIYIAKIGDFDKTENKIIKTTAQYISAFFNLPVKFINDISLSSIPQNAQRINPQTNDKQLLTTYLLDNTLKQKKPNDAFCLIGFTSYDLWPGEDWNFVFGQASMYDNVGVWSIYRNGNPQKSDYDYNLFLKRTIKTGLHEIGHMLSIYHCIYYECLMNGTNHIKESDNAPLWLCPVDLKKLTWNLNIEPIKRFNNLINLTTKLKFNEETNFYKKTINLMENK